MEPSDLEKKPPNETQQSVPVSTEEAIENLLKTTKDNTDTIIISAAPDGKPVILHTKNLYPRVRHIMLIGFVLLCATLIIFLMHQNGKSIYDNGI